MPVAKNGERPYPGAPKTQFLGPVLWLFQAYPTVCFCPHPHPREARVLLV